LQQQQQATANASPVHPQPQAALALPWMVRPTNDLYNRSRNVSSPASGACDPDRSNDGQPPVCVRAQ